MPFHCSMTATCSASAIQSGFVGTTVSGRLDPFARVRALKALGFFQGRHQHAADVLGERSVHFFNHESNEWHE